MKGRSPENRPQSVSPKTSRSSTRGPKSIILALMVALDVLVVSISTNAAISLRTHLDWFPAAPDAQGLLYPIAAVIVALWLALLYTMGAYRSGDAGSGTTQYRAVLNASVLTAGILGIVGYLSNYPLSRAFFFLLFTIGTPALLLGRYALRRTLHAARTRGRLRSPVILAGDPGSMAQIAEVLTRERWMGYDIVGVLTHARTPAIGSPFPVLGTPDDLLPAIRQTHAEAIIFAEGSFRRAHHFNHLARTLESEDCQLFVVPALTEIASNRMEMHTIGGIPLLTVTKPQATRTGRMAKRAFDVVGAILAIIATSPIMIAAAIAVKREDGGPVIFRQPRVGRDNVIYDCLKFRSMVVNADKLHAQLAAEANDGSGHLFKLKDDPRITKVGKFIRRYSIDELPQLFNVLRGEMSLVGPRPALENEVARYKQHVLRRLAVRPGITGLWQVSGRSDLSWDDTVRLDLYYVDNWSFLQDMSILARTVKAVFSSSGAY